MKEEILKKNQKNLEEEIKNKENISLKQNE